MNDSAIQAIDDFFGKHTKVLYKKGDLVLRAGDPPSGALYLKSGLVRMSFATDIGEMLVLHVFKSGSVFPLTWVINSTPNRYYFEALAPCEIWRAPKEDVLQLFQNQPDIAQYMMTRVVRGLSGLMNRMEFLVFDSAYKKTVLLLLHYVKNFGSNGSGGDTRITLTHKEIAAWIGTTRETASLQIELLKKKKLITYNRRTIIIPDLQKLAQETDILREVN